jgi:hypothetical protein
MRIFAARRNLFAVEEFRPCRSKERMAVPDPLGGRALRQQDAVRRAFESTRSAPKRRFLLRFRPRQKIARKRFTPGCPPAAALPYGAVLLQQEIRRSGRAARQVAAHSVLRTCGERRRRSLFCCDRLRRWRHAAISETAHLCLDAGTIPSRRRFEIGHRVAATTAIARCGSMSSFQSESTGENACLSLSPPPRCSAS